MNTDKKTSVKFKDKNNNLCSVDIEITHRNGYPEFTMTGEMGSSGGQCYDSIVMADSKQKKLIEFWKTYHLNGTNAGNKKQTAQIKLMEEKTTYDYDKAKSYLNSLDTDGKPLSTFEVEEIDAERKNIKAKITEMQKEIQILADTKAKNNVLSNSNAYRVNIKELNIINKIFNTDRQMKNFFTQETTNRTTKLDDLKKILEIANEKTMLFGRDNEGVLYSYGATWFREDLPSDLWEQVETLVKDINAIEDLKKAKGGDWEDIDDYKLVALGKFLNIEPNESKEDITQQGSDMFSYCGTDYLVMTTSEADERMDDYFEEVGKDCWKIEVANDSEDCGFEEWKKAQIYHAKYGECLNGYDGTEYHDSEANLYIMRG